jgi:glutathione S-transferase
MAPPTYRLYSPPGSFRAFAPLIVAEYNGIHIDVVVTTGAGTEDAGEDVEAAIKSMSPTGKAPILERVEATSASGRGNNNDNDNNVVLFSSHAVARYVAGLRPDTGLLGNGSIQDRARIDAWMDWVAQDVELPACVWFYPAVGYMADDNPAA